VVRRQVWNWRHHEHSTIPVDCIFGTGEGLATPHLDETAATSVDLMVLAVGARAISSIERFVIRLAISEFQRSGRSKPGRQYRWWQWLLHRASCFGLLVCQVIRCNPAVLGKELALVRTGWKVDRSNTINVIHVRIPRRVGISEFSIKQCIKLGSVTFLVRASSCLAHFKHSILSVGKNNAQKAVMWAKLPLTLSGSTRS
jgi:hypothetical protein